MRHILYNGTVFTRDTALPMIEDGAVVWEGDKILELGPRQELLEKYPQAQRLDAKGGVIMPAFINAHHHIYSAFARGLSIPGNSPTDFLEVLEGTWWRIDRNLDLAMTRYSGYMTMIECIRSGVTTIFDHHASFCEIPGSLSQLAEAAKDTGVRSCLCYEISDRDGEEKSRQSVQENLNFGRQCKEDKSGLLSAMCGMHASFTISEATMAYTREHWDGGFHIHVCEGSYDRDHCREHYNETVPERLYRHGILGPQTICGHCVYLSDSDRQLLGSTGTAVVHNPQSNMGNAVGVTDVMKLFEAGVTVGLGTDGFTSDMLESMKHANVLIKHFNRHPSMGWNETFTMALDNNALLAQRHFGGRFGLLAPGAMADIIVSDYKPFTPMDGGNLNGHLLFGMNGRNITTTVGSGRVLMHDREIVSVDEEKIMYECRRQAGRLWEKLCGGN